MKTRKISIIILRVALPLILLLTASVGSAQALKTAGPDSAFRKELSGTSDSLPASVPITSSKIVFQGFPEECSSDASRCKPNIFVIKGETGYITPLTHGLDPEQNIDPYLNEGGTMIAFARYPSSPAGYQLYTMDVDGANIRQLTSLNGSVSHPSWSPDGSRIVFGLADGERAVYVIQADGSGLQKLVTSGISRDPQPAWSPDGTKIAFASDLEGKPFIYVMNADGGGVRKLSNQENSAHPVWSPDSAKILYEVDSAGNGFVPSLWVMNADGTGQAPLIPGDGYSLEAGCWSPDGNYILYDRIEGTTHAGTFIPLLGYLYLYSIQDRTSVQLTRNQGDRLPSWKATIVGGPAPWVKAQKSTIAIPGAEFRLTVLSGNMTGWVSPGTTIRASLPAGITFRNASVPVSASFQNVAWQVGDIPGKTTLPEVSLVLRLSDNASPYNLLQIAFQISTSREEDPGFTYRSDIQVGFPAYLPFVGK